MNGLIRFDPFEEMQALQKQFFGDDLLGAPRKAMHMPTTDVYTEDDKQLSVEAHLPNFNEEDVDIHVENGALVISAQRHEKDEDKKKKYVIRESSASFYRRIQLPDRADEKDIKAHMEDGVLKVTVPFKELPKPKKIAINSKSKSKSKK